MLSVVLSIVSFQPSMVAFQ